MMGMQYKKTIAVEVAMFGHFLKPMVTRRIHNLGITLIIAVNLVEMITTNTKYNMANHTTYLN
mgnify:CR=1 FL=1